MIGYQCSPSVQGSGSMRAPSGNGPNAPNKYQSDAEATSCPLPAAVSDTSSRSKSASGEQNASANNDQNNTNNDNRQRHEAGEQSPQVSIKREPSSCQTVLSSLTSHINLINQDSLAAGKQTHTSSTSVANQEATGQQSSLSAASSVSPSQLISSPGYHSAASSPGSSAASPVSSSSSATASSACSALSNSSGISTVHSSSSVSPSSSRSPISPNLLDYYPEINQDGLGLSWFHDANSRARLSAALMTNRMLVSGDISLAEMSRYPMPIMARPPLGVSDITLENWLQEVVQTQPQRGIKLTFTSTRTVEPAFRVLARYTEHIKGPLILNADILTRPTNSSPQISGAGRSASANRQQQQQQQMIMMNNNGALQQPVDAWTFLMLCRTRFPKSIISIGWCPAAGSTCSNRSSVQEHSMAMADSSSSLHSSADSMFELDIMDSHLAAAAAAAAGAASHLGHLQHLNQQQQSRLHPHLNPYQLLQPQSNQQTRDQQLRQLGNPFNQYHQQQHQQLSQQLSQNNHHSHNHHLLHHHHNHHHPHHSHQHHLNHQHSASLSHHIPSSTGSLNSSSGNSSSSPSPTSPISHLMSPPHQTVATNLSLGGQRQGAPDSTEQLFLNSVARSGQSEMKSSLSGATGGGQSASSAAAAVMAAAVVVATSFQHMPLNLNINEASIESRPQKAQHSAGSNSTSSLSNLAKKIQSYQTLAQKGANGAANLSIQQTGNTQASPGNESSPIASSQLANKLFASGQHISKKTALTAISNQNNNCTPSSSPNQQHHHHSQPVSSSNNLLLKTTGQQQQQQQLQTQQPHAVNPAINANNSQIAPGAGYTREMIDKMASLVKEYNLTQPVTFPVEVRLLKNSLAELQRLLYQVGSNSTLTVMAQQDDLTSVDDLLTIRRAFATNQILFDLPDDLAASFKQELDLL